MKVNWSPGGLENLRRFFFSLFETYYHRSYRWDTSVRRRCPHKIYFVMTTSAPSIQPQAAHRHNFATLPGGALTSGIRPLPRY